MGDLDVVPVAPTVRGLRWCALSPPLRAEVVRELAEAEGLDGWAAFAAVASAVQDPASPWGEAFDRATAAALRRCVLEPVAAFGRALAEALRPAVEAVGRVCAGFAEALAKLPPDAVPAEWVTCMCWCATHGAVAVDVCLVEVEPGALEAVTFTSPLDGNRRTARMCGPCADAQRARLAARQVSA